MSVTLQVNGRDMTFSEKELSCIVEKYFLSKATKKVVQKPTIDKWFEVKPQTIDQKLFEEERKNYPQEKMRKLIVEAFEEMEKNPEKYSKNFKTTIKNTEVRLKTVIHHMEIASILGDHIADWVEQALEWAQRIANGESWESLCNERDTLPFYRLVIWKDGVARCVGGSIYDRDDLSASFVDQSEWGGLNLLYNTVPLIVDYE